MKGSYYDSLKGDTLLPWLPENNDSLPGTNPDPVTVSVNSAPEKQGWPASGKGYPPVTIRVCQPRDSGVGRTGALRGLCLILVVLVALLIGLTAGVAIGHFLWRPVAVTQQCGQIGNAAEYMDYADPTAEAHVKRVPASELISPDHLEVISIDDSGSGEVDMDSGSGEVDAELIYLRHKSLSQCHVDICYIPPVNTPLLTFSTQAVQYYQDTGMSLLPYNTLLITVQFCKSGYIGLLTEKGVDNRDMIEVIMAGGSVHSNGVGIRSCHECYLPYKGDMEYLPEEQMPLSQCNQYSTFWLHWNADTVRLGRYLVPFENELIVRPNPLGRKKPKYLALNTGFYADVGHWLIYFENH